VFFPALVLLIRCLAGLGVDYAIAGLIICNAFAFLSFVAMYAAFRHDFSPQIADRALLAYAVMPTSFFLNSVYTEPLFICFALACLYFARQNHWWPAGVFAALAALTRNLGIFLFVCLAYEYYLQHRPPGHPARSMLALFLAPAVLLGFILYNAVSFGDPVAFVHSQQAWGRGFGWPGENFIRNLGQMRALIPNTQAGIALDTFMVLTGLAGLCTASISYRTTMPISYLIAGWLWFLIPLCSTSPFLPLYSMSRFVLVVFPLYIVFARMPRAVFAGFLFVNALLLSLCTILFINWYWIG
jgi:Predicted integral membrane protein